MPKRLLRRAVKGLSKVGGELTKGAKDIIPEGHRRKVVRGVTELMLGPKTYKPSKQSQKETDAYHAERRKINRSKARLRRKKSGS